MDIDYNFEIKNRYFENSIKYKIPHAKALDLRLNINKGYGRLANKTENYMDNLNNINLQVFNIENINDDNFTTFNNFLDDVINLYNEKTSNIIYPYDNKVGGGMGGHAGAIEMIIFSYKTGDQSKYEPYLGKKFTQTKYIKNESNTEDKINIDIELFIYFFFLKINLLEIINLNIFSNLKNLIDILTISYLPYIKEKKQYDILINKNKNDENYFTLGNIKKTNPSHNILDYKLGCYTINISEKKINTLVSKRTMTSQELPTTMTSTSQSQALQSSLSMSSQSSEQKNKYLSDMKNLEEQLNRLPAQDGGVKGLSLITLTIYKKTIAKYFNDFTSTSSHYGFRCEGVDDLFNVIYNENLFLLMGDDFNLNYNSWNNKYLNSNNINIHVPESKTNNSTYNYDIQNYKYIEKKIKKLKLKEAYNFFFNPDKGIVSGDGNYKHAEEMTEELQKSSYLLLNKNKIFTKLSYLNNELYTNFNKLKLEIQLKIKENNNNVSIYLKFLCLMNHFTFVNYFDYDNSVIRKIIKAKTSLFNKAPNYFIPPLSQFDIFYGNYTDVQKNELHNNLYNLINRLIINQLRNILEGNEVLCCAFVGASIVTNKETQNVRLIDFGHPIFFNAANLQYLLKGKINNNNYNNTNLRTEVVKPDDGGEEDIKYRQIFSIFMNFAYGALSYYFMITMYFGIENLRLYTPNLLNVIEYLYFATYYTQNLTSGFPLITENTDGLVNNFKLNIETYMSNDDLIKKLLELNTTAENTPTNTAQSNTQNTSISEVSEVSEVLENIILPSKFEEELLLSKKKKEKKKEKNKYKLDLSESRCDLVKYLYILRLYNIFKNNNMSIPIEIKINRYQ